MEDVTRLLQEVTEETYDAADIPFDFVEEGVATAMICEADPAIRERLATALEGMGYRLTKAESARDALKKCRFHVYDVIVVDELFNAVDPEGNAVLAYLSQLPMAVRREMFVCLISGRYRTTDKMAAFRASVNLVINKSNVDDMGAILKTGITENMAFYRIFKETLKKLERI